MSVFRWLRKFSQPNLALPASADATSSLSPDTSDEPPQRRRASEPMPLGFRALRKGPSTASDGGPREMPVPMPLPVPSGVPLLNLAVVPPPEVTPATGPVPDNLAEVWDAVKEGPSILKTSRGPDAIGATIATVQNNAAPFVPIIKATVAAVEQTNISKTIKDGIDMFHEGTPVLMKALDELKTSHPFIGVAVLAFKTVYTLEQNRRDNDKKIIALYAGMKDMMGALLLLKGMENDKLIAPDGTSIKDRLRSLVDCIAKDIKDCSNACDTYTKKRLLAKVLLSSVWDAKLLDFAKLFATRRREFQLELTIHTSQGVDKAHVKLDVIADTTRALNEQMNVMKALFEQFISPEQKRLSELVAAKGGIKACKDDDKILLELDKATGKGPSASKADGSRARREQHKDITLSVDDLRRDVLENPDIAAEKNLTAFYRKFDAQKNQIVDELTLVFERESDRVIRELKGGAHDRILDKSIHEIWKEMAWRGNVKARHFVLALRDHYLEKRPLGTESILGMGTAGVDTVPEPDTWAIKYIDIMRLQPIMEAIDDDASGFITIQEMNRFTSSRPVDWSLPHWVAFWAVGYKASIINYANKIQELFAKMDGIRAEVHPLNRQAIIRYFTNVWIPVHELVTAVLSLGPVEDDLEKFKPHVEAEEARLANNLRAVDYIIDGTDTLTLITGVGRIEKTVFPLLYLLMKRHYEIMRVMRTKVLDLNVLVEGMQSMDYVQDAITYRVDDLTSNFSQQKLDMEKQFQNFAYGMFKYFIKTLWSEGYVRNLDPPITPYNDANEDQGVNLEDILKLQSSDEPLSLNYWLYDGHSIDDIPTYRDVEPPLKDLLGHWHGYCYGDEGARETEGTDSMLTFVLESAEGERDFKANGWCIRGRFTITGSWYKGDKDITQVKFKMTFYTSSYGSDLFFNCHFDPERDALTGIWGFSAELQSSNSPVKFRRIAPRYLTVYPSIKELSDNKPRSLWKFAISAVQNDIRQKNCSWSYFAQRRDDRETVLSLAIRYCFYGKPIDHEEGQKLRAVVQRLTSADACFYGSMVNRKCAYTLIHDNAYCDSCDGPIGGVRLLCLDCVPPEWNAIDTLDLCCAPESRCIDARITHREDLREPHEPNHRLVKLRTPVPVYQYGRMYKPTFKAFERVKELCTKIAKADRSPQEKLETGQDAREASSLILTTTEELSTSVKRDNVLSVEDGTKHRTEAKPITTEVPSSTGGKLEDALTAVNDTLGGAEAEPTVIELPSKSDKSDDVPAAADVPSAVNGTEDRVEVEPTVTATPSKSVEPDSVLVVTDGTRDEVEAEEQEGKAPPSTAQAQGKDTDLPTCGNCNGPLSFPFWHCIHCEDYLFICDACDTDGVPELMRSTGKHTEEHHVIRCLAPAKGDDAIPATEERLASIEGRLDSLHVRFDDLSGRIGNIEQLLHKLTGITDTTGAVQP